MSDDLKKRILEFLHVQTVANVATVEGDRPHVSALEYVHDDMTLYFVSMPHTQKVANLVENPAVAVSINGPGRKREEIMGVQYFGKAERVDDEAERESVKTLFFDKYLLEPSAHWFKQHMLLYKVTPERVDLIDYSQGFGHKDTWTA